MEISNLTVKFGDITPISDLNISIPDKGVVAVTGTSGAGKSTFLKVIVGLVKPTSGEVRDIDGLKISMVFQEDRLIPWLNAKENIMICASEADADEWIAKTEIKGSEGKFPDELSGGMQRRVAIARAMCYHGDMLILDEPFKGLDKELCNRIIGHIKGKFQLIIIATHNIEEAKKLSSNGEVHEVKI